MSPDDFAPLRPLNAALDDEDQSGWLTTTIVGFYAHILGHDAANRGASIVVAG